MIPLHRPSNLILDHFVLGHNLCSSDPGLISTGALDAADTHPCFEGYGSISAVCNGLSHKSLLGPPALGDGSSSLLLLGFSGEGGNCPSATHVAGSLFMTGILLFPPCCVTVPTDGQEVGVLFNDLFNLIMILMPVLCQALKLSFLPLFCD